MSGRSQVIGYPVNGSFLIFITRCLITHNTLRFVFVVIMVKF